MGALEMLCGGCFLSDLATSEVTGPITSPGKHFLGHVLGGARMEVGGAPLELLYGGCLLAVSLPRGDTTKNFTRAQGSGAHSQDMGETLGASLGQSGGLAHGHLPRSW